MHPKRIRRLSATRSLNLNILRRVEGRPPILLMRSNEKLVWIENESVISAGTTLLVSLYQQQTALEGSLVGQ